MALTILICTLIVLIIVIPLNIIGFVWGARFVSKIYEEKLAELIVIIRDGMAERDAKFQKLKGMLSTSILRDFDVFDGALEDYSDLADDEETDNEREEDSQEGDQ
jgi:hypothetical protein